MRAARTAYVVVPFPPVTQQPVADLHTAGPGNPFAVVDFGGSQVHVFTEEQAREAAAAFTRAGDLLASLPAAGLVEAAVMA